MKMYCTKAQAVALFNARSLSRYDRKQIKRRIFAEIRAEHKLPRKPAITLFVENEDNPMFCLIRDKRTKLPLDDGRPEPAPVLPHPAESVKKAPVAKKAVAKKATAPAKKVAAKPATKKAAPAKKPAAKAVTKKAPAKAPAKAVAKPAKPRK